MTARREGYFLIADIGGYTAFLSGTELEHAQGIIEDLCAVMHRALVPALTFVKLEGDALFCYGDAQRFTDGERLLELIETCHFDFRCRADEMQRNTMCSCAACASIHTLDLKFVAHFGEFVLQRLGGASDIAGPDVILVHRMLKNSVVDSTGWHAYALLTTACGQRAGTTDGWTPRAEELESFGRVECLVRDLAPGTAARQQAHRVFVEPDAADFSFSYTFAAAPAVVWQYWFDRDKRARWQTDVVSLDYDKNGGRMRPGAVGHCDHGAWASDMRIVDWRPFSYYTLERTTTRSSLAAAPSLTETMELVPLDDGTSELRYRMRARTTPGKLKMKLAGPMVRRSFEREFVLLARAIEEDDAGAPSSAASLDM
jgi:uncharacterized protein YndB with AHSA1/START domain